MLACWFYYSVMFLNSLTLVRVFTRMLSDNLWCSLWALSSLSGTSHVTLIFSCLNFYFFILVHDYTLCCTGSPCCNVNYYSYISIWPYYYSYSHYIFAESYQSGAVPGVYGGPAGYQTIPGQQPSYIAAQPCTIIQTQPSVVVVGGCPACRVCADNTSSLPYIIYPCVRLNQKLHL